jgi:predicted dehydrogenase
VRIGVLGVANIVLRSLLEPAVAIGGVEVAAVAARDPIRAAAFADEHGIGTVHPSYEALIADDSLDAVYIPLPNSLHAEWSIASLESGRHVLCEKPFAMNAAQARQMAEVAERTRRLLVEAFHWRYHPVAARMIELSRQIGPLQYAEVRFNGFAPSTDIRYQRDLGGGSFMDLGCYCIHQIRVVTGEEPQVISASATEGPAGVDTTMEAELAFDSGLRAIVGSSMVDKYASWPEAMSFHLDGRDGSLDVLNPMAPQLGHRIKAQWSDGSAIDEVLDVGTSYEHQLRAFCRQMAGKEQPITGGPDAIATMVAIDAVYEASGLGVRQ